MYKLSKQAKDLTGMTFNKLTVLYPVGRIGKSRAIYWRCKCECGTEVEIKSDTLQRESKSCGKGSCMRSHYAEYPENGSRFGMLISIDFSHTGTGGVYWNFKCDCGSTAKIRWYRVRDGVIDHCGCQSARKMVLAHKTNDRDEQVIKDMLRQYRHNATKRNLSWSLTEDQFSYLVKQNCFYCGSAPNKARHARKRKFLNTGNTILNGIDRALSDQGYTIENCVPCCKFCNYVKRTDTIDDFISWIKTLNKYVSVSGDVWAERGKAVEINLRLFLDSSVNETD